MLFDLAIESLPQIISWQKRQSANQFPRPDLQRYIGAQEHIAKALQQTTFFELAKSACSLIYEANLNPLAVASAFPDLRFPSQRAWIEFDSEMRYLACEQAGQVAPEREGARATRMAFFVECDSEGCRQGTIYRFINFTQPHNGGSAAWRDIGLNTIEKLAQLDRIAYRFNFDAEPTRYTREQLDYARDQIAFSRNQILARRKRNELATPLDKLLDQDDETVAKFLHMGHCFEPHWFGGNKSSLSSQLGNWAGEQTFLTSFLALLLTDVVETEMSNLQKVNKARSKKGKPELRDYITIRLKRGTKVYEKEIRSTEGPQQGTPRRFHMVSGHLRFQPTKSGPKLIWIAPHARGKNLTGDRYKVV